MHVTVGFSKEFSAKNAINETVSRFINPKLIFFFAPVNAFMEISKLFTKKFPNCEIIGISSHYSYAEANVIENGLAAVSFEDGFEFTCGILTEINRFPSKNKKILEDAATKIPGHNTVCMEFMTAFSNNEDIVINLLDSVCRKKSIPVAGACASANLDEFGTEINQSKTYISRNGTVYENACVFTFIHNKTGKIMMAKDDIFGPSKQTFTITSINFEKNIIYTLDNIPARDALAKAYRCTAEDVPLLLRSYPLGRVVGKKYYMSDIIKINDNGSFVMNTSIYNGVNINIFNPLDYRTITRKTLANIVNIIPNPSFTFCINSITRTMFYIQEQYLHDWEKESCLSLKPSFGFSSMGEQIENRNLNQVFFAVVFE